MGSDLLLCYFQISQDVPDTVLLLTPNLILMWLKSIFYTLVIILNLLQFLRIVPICIQK
jgi:hypothetical protein